jgi:hypothetical protein
MTAGAYVEPSEPKRRQARRFHPLKRGYPLLTKQPYGAFLKLKSDRFEAAVSQEPFPVAPEDS